MNHLPPIGETLAFAPRDNARMTLPIVHERCIAPAKVECGDALGAIKLWPHERLQVAAHIGREHLLATHGANTLLVHIADTTPIETDLLTQS